MPANVVRMSERSEFRKRSKAREEVCEFSCDEGISAKGFPVLIKQCFTWNLLSGSIYCG